MTHGGVLVAAVTGETARAFIELGGVVLLLGFLARVAGRAGITAIPLFLVGGLFVGEGGFLASDIGEDFIAFASEIGVLLLLLSLGLEYSGSELRAGLRSGGPVGALDAALNFTPGFLTGLILGWEIEAAILLGGVTWVSSSGVIAKVLADLERLGNRETPSVLNLLVIEDLAMAVYLPIVGALVSGRGAGATAVTVGVALVVVTVILAAAMSWGDHVSRHLGRGSDESLLLGVVGLTLLVGGVAQELEVSAAIGAFLVGLGLSGPTQERASELMDPLRDLFAAWFFLFFALQIDLDSLPPVLLAAVALAIVTALGKIATGWVAARRIGAAVPGRMRAGTVLIARGEFSIVIAALGAGLADGESLGALAAAYVLLTALVGPLATKYAQHLPVPARSSPEQRARPGR
jgi:CPA2 family monovalent cation:H+ antiporter-2